MSIGLPPPFTSLYRLFLRTTAASVLNKRPAVQRLRLLWRPTFESAAQALHSLEDTTLTDSERRQLQRRYAIWERRLDNTLSLLAISACSRGLAHRLTRNLDILKRHNQALATKPDSYTQRHYWDPRLPSNSERYKPVIVLADSPPGSKADKKERWRRLDLEAWGALGEVILMAEGRDGISLGRIKSGASPLRGPDEQKQ